MKPLLALGSLCTSFLVLACAAPERAESRLEDAGNVPAASSEVPEFAIIELEHEDADAMAATLNDFILDATAGTAAPSETSVMADPRTNSLLVMASTARLEELRALVRLLDTAGPE